MYNNSKKIFTVVMYFPHVISLIQVFIKSGGFAARGGDMSKNAEIYVQGCSNGICFEKSLIYDDRTLELVV